MTSDGIGDRQVLPTRGAQRTPAELLVHLEGLDVRVWVEGDRLRVSAPKDVLTPSLREELTTRKDEILKTLASTRPAAPASASSSDGRPAPVSFAQRRLWFLDQLHPQTSAYNIAGALRLGGDLDVSALDRALQEVVRRHDSLRTVFATIDGEPVQVVTETPSGLFVRDVLDDLDGDPEVHVRRLMLDEVRRPFDLARGPLFRATLFRLHAREHVLVLVVHHIISDGWSAGVFTRELSAIYATCVAGESPPLPSLPMQYGDFARWQQQWLAGPVVERELAYWTRQLAGYSGVLDLPSDRPRPAVQTFRGAIVKTRLSPALSEALTALSRQEAVTPFMTLLAAFKALLWRHTGQDDLVVGTPIANRTRVETEGLIGFFANTLVLRTDLSGNPTFRELLHRVREVTLGAYAHQDVPFEKIVEVMQPPRDMSRLPLVQVMLSLQNLPPRDIELSGLVLQPVELERGVARMDLTLEVVEDPGGLKLTFEYNTDVFDAARIEAMAGHFETLLAGGVADPTCHVAKLPILSHDEQRRLLVDWNTTFSEMPAVAGVHELIARQARLTPDAVAVVFESERLSYRELHVAAQRVSRRLHALGVGPGVVVGLCVERSLDMLVGLLGILQAGAPYLPLDPAYPAERLAFMIEDAGCPVLVTQERLRGRLPAHDARMVTLDNPPAEWSRDVDDVSWAPPVTGDDVAYVIYTSGSTGRPKGVQISHRALVNLLVSMSRMPGLTARDVLLAVTTLSFDIAGLELLLPLIVGGRVVIASRDVATDGIALSRALHASGVTVMQATPATWQMLVDAGWRGQDGLKILCGGEALPRVLADALLERAGEVWNLYGPTETTIWSTVHRVGPHTGPVPIGRPIDNTRLYVLDGRGQPVPIGVAGELHIGGRGVARGYLNRTDLTADRFVPDPFAVDAGARMYRTGDLARYLPDGSVEYLGRLDHQVKVRGFRIELGEIEAALAEHPAVRQAVAVAREEAPGDRRLVAYVVSDQLYPELADELRARLRSRLPEYMVPSTFTVLDALPLTSNGKVDRKRLPVPTLMRPAAAVEPETPLEQSIVEVWREVLNRSDVGVDDNFFDLGGHSLLVVRMLAAIKQACGQQLPVSALFAGPTIRHLVAAIRERRERVPLTPIQAGGSRQPFFFLYGDWAGGGYYSRDLARQVGPEQPFYVFHPWGLDGSTVPPTIEAMAEEYLRALRAVRPTGPYLLGGYCNGGLVALEMAQRLRAQGEQVSFFLAIDAMAWNVRLRWLQRLTRWLARVCHLPSAPAQRLFLALHGAVVVAARLWNSRRSSQDALRKVYRRLRGQRPVREQPNALDLLYRRAIRSYVPAPYPGRITLFVTDELAGNRFERDWHKVANDIEVYRMPGDHLTLVKQHVDVVARQLMACLDEIQRCADR